MGSEGLDCGSPDEGQEGRSNTGCGDDRVDVGCGEKEGRKLGVLPVWGRSDWVAPHSWVRGLMPAKASSKSVRSCGGREGQDAADSGPHSL